MTKQATPPVLTPSTTYEYLNRALHLLEQPNPWNYEPNSWIQHAEAIDKDHHYCNPESERACAWCTIGVVKAVTHYDPDPQAAYKYVMSILNMANPNIIQQGSAPVVNDTAKSFNTVRRMFQKAMNLAIRFETHVKE